MKLLGLILILFITDGWCQTVTRKFIINNEQLDWWQTAIFYQVYPRSFKDSNNDGIGDLQGVIQKLDHIVDSGANAVWLSPIYQSPMVDGGYDISDYRAIATEYGTLDDFRQLVSEAHTKGLKVILDFVPNHTSDKHEWFQKSVNKENGYEDYYFWADAKVDENGNRVPPNNWISVWGHSGWAWNEERQQYYFHQFSDKQPDLNYYSEKVHQEMKDILKFWLDMGVDGFRVDAVPHIYEDNGLQDEPKDPDSDETDPNSYSYLKHVFTKDQPDTFELVYSWREFLDNYTKTEGGDTRILMTECATELSNVFRYYGNEDGSVLGAHFSFNFDFLGLREDSRPLHVMNAVMNWLMGLPLVYTINWLTGNHDNSRIGSRVGERNIDGYNMMIMFLPGITITYMGEEIGQLDGEVTCEQGQDPSAIGNCTTFNTTSRDFERTPFQWDDSVNAGFNDGAPTWLPVSEKYKEVNLAKQVKENRSHYHVYQELANIKSQLVDLHSITLIRLNSDVLEMIRNSNDNNEEYTLLFNMGEIDRTLAFEGYVKGSYIVLSSGVNSDYLPGDKIDNNRNVSLRSGNSLILKTILDIY